MDLLPEPAAAIFYLDHHSRDGVTPTFAFRFATDITHLLMMLRANQRISICRSGDERFVAWRIMSNLGLIDPSALERHLALSKAERDSMDMTLRRTIDLSYYPSETELLLFEDGLRVAKRFQLILSGTNGAVMATISQTKEILSASLLEWHRVPRF